MRSKKQLILPPLVLCTILVTPGCRPGNHNNVDWPVYKADALSSSFSPLTMVNRSNVAMLQRAWTFDPADNPPGARSANSECNPIEVNGIVYATSARHRVYAV